MTVRHADLSGPTMTVPGIVSPVAVEVAEWLDAERRQGHALLRVGTQTVRLAIGEPDLPGSGYRPGWDEQGRPVRDVAQSKAPVVLQAHQALHRRLPHVVPKNRSTTVPTTVDIDQLLAALTDRSRGTASGWFPGLRRAAEHLVSDFDPANAATRHGVIATGTAVPVGWVAALTASRVNRVLARLPLLVEGQPAREHPALPILTTAPTAGPQGGEKQAAYSQAFTVADDINATMIDSTISCNVSLQLETAAPGVVQALMRLAVVAEAESQVLDALAAAATETADLGAALDAVTNPWTPTLIVASPSYVLGLGAGVPALQTAGVTIVATNTASAPLVMDPNAVVGWLDRVSLNANEPAVIGRSVAEAIWGRVTASPGAVATVTGV